MRRTFFGLWMTLACGSTPPATVQTYPSHSSALGLTRDGSELFVVNPDADSVGEIDLVHRTRTREILLAGAPPTPDANGNFVPTVMPRAVALSPDGHTLYVTGERSGRLHFVDVASAAQSSVIVGSEPVGLVVSDDGASAYVACSQDNTVVRVDAATRKVTASVPVPNEPWALALSPNGSTLYVTHFLGAAVTALDVTTMSVLWTSIIADVAPRGDKRLAHGQPRGLYDAVVRPGAEDLWVIHALLGTDTAQPDLDFESTAFPAVTVMSEAGAVQQVMSTDAQDVPGVNGAFGDIVSGPHAVAFTHDGVYALVVDGNSEDVLVVDARSHVEVSLLRPLPGHQPEGIVISPDDRFAYVEERNTHDVVVIDLDRSTGVLVPVVDGSPISTLETDPMPAPLRLGQHLFSSADSDEYPISRNHWVACATCHMEGRSDAVTWRFEQGPRDTPTNAGGMINTGFLFRTGDRAKVQDYWRTINIEQGGTFDPFNPNQVQLLDAIAAYVNQGIPFPVPPTTDAALVAKGAALFESTKCTSCHSGPRLTDSGGGNSALDLAGTVLLHDVGTCTTSIFPDVAHPDIEGHARAACLFDTPSLNGLASSPPYMHDGSAPTIRDAVRRMYTAAGAQPLNDSDETALVEYLRSL